MHDLRSDTDSGHPTEKGNYRLPYFLVALTFLKWHNYQLPSLGSHESKEHQDSDLLDTIGNSFLVTQVICRKFISIFVFRVGFLLLFRCGKDKRKINEANLTPRGQASSVILGRTEALWDGKEAKNRNVLKRNFFQVKLSLNSYLIKVKEDVLLFLLHWAWFFLLSIVGWKYCVSFRCTAKWFSHIYIYTDYFPLQVIIDIKHCSCITR